MYGIKVIESFSGAHNLKNYKGKCEKLHGHNWKVEVTASCSGLNEAGMVLDFKELKTHLKDTLVKLDHAYLNEIPYFKKQNPTSEIIAKFIFDSISKKAKFITGVTVWETDFFCATYHSVGRIADRK